MTPEKELPVIDLDKKLKELTSMRPTFFYKLFMIVSLAIILFATFLVTKEYNTKKWPSVTGKILMSRLVRSGSKLKPKIVYQYSVGDRTFKGENIYAGTLILSLSSPASTLIKQYPEGKKVTVYYNPKNPQEAVLKRGINIDAMVLLGVGLFMFFIALFIYRSQQVTEIKLDGYTGRGFKPEELGLADPARSYPSKTEVTRAKVKKFKFAINIIGILIMVLSGWFIFRPLLFNTKKVERYPKTAINKHHENAHSTRQAATSKGRNTKNQWKRAKQLFSEGGTYLRNKEYAKAEEKYRQSLSILDKIGGTSLPAYPTVLNLIGYSLHAQGKLGEAEKFYKESISILEKNGKPNEIAAARACEGLARIYMKEGKYNLVEPLYKRAIKIWDKVRGPNNGNTLSVKSRYAYLLDKLGRHDEAQKMREEVIEARRKWRQKSNPKP